MQTEKALEEKSVKKFNVTGQCVPEMGRYIKIDPKIYLQVRTAREYMKVHNLSPAQFVELDDKYKILDYLNIGYESFHLMGKKELCWNWKIILIIRKAKIYE